MLIGGVLGAAVIIPLSLAASGVRSYQEFYQHTLQVHDQTPLTNHMGLRVLVAHNMKAQAVYQIGRELSPLAESATNRGWISDNTVSRISDAFDYKEAASAASGRMKFTKDVKLRDPFEVWKRMRNERYARYKWVAYGIIAALFAFFVYVLRRIKTLWVAECLGQIFIILLSQLTCYYYSFMILTAPLTKVRRDIEVPLFGLAALSQFVWINSYWNDDKYTALTLISLAFCVGLLCAFTPKGALLGLFKRETPDTTTTPTGA
jgi:hypothetical protein